MSEIELQRSIIKTLQHFPWLEVRRNSIIKRGFYSGGLGDGSSDLIVCVERARDGAGLMGAIEVKESEAKFLEQANAKPGTKLHKRHTEQLGFIERIRALGGFGGFVWSVDMATELVTKARKS